MTSPEPGFEIEVANVEEFLRLLKERETENAQHNGHGSTRKAIFVAQMVDYRPSNYVFPLVRRYVVAAFARTTSNAVELPETVGKIEDRQQEAYGEIRTQIERGLEDLDLRVPVREGFLRHPTNTGHDR
jgi:hypothetical protein